MLCLFLIDTLKRLLPPSHVINQRSKRTLFKHHYRDFLDLALNSLKIVKSSDFDKANELTLDEDLLSAMPVYVVLEGVASVWRVKSQ